MTTTTKAKVKSKRTIYIELRKLYKKYCEYSFVNYKTKQIACPTGPFEWDNEIKFYIRNIIPNKDSETMWLSNNDYDISFNYNQIIALWFKEIEDKRKDIIHYEKTLNVIDYLQKKEWLKITNQWTLDSVLNILMPISGSDDIRYGTVWYKDIEQIR